MLFRKEEIVTQINNLISNEAIRMILSHTQYHINHPNNDNEEEKTRLEAEVKQRTTNINYLKQLRARIKVRPSEKELIALLKEIEGAPIQIGFQTYTTGQLVSDKDLPKSLEPMKKIHHSLSRQLSSLEYSEKTQGKLFIGEVDESGQIDSPVIRQFVENSKASNREQFENDSPPALPDLRRGVQINGKTFSNFSDDAIRKEIRAFLGTSEKFRNNEKAKEALCHVILKNGQGLQELFMLEYAQSDPKKSPLMIDDKSYMVGDNNTFYNWAINSAGDLCMDLELDVKSLMLLSGQTEAPFIMDSKTGELRPYNKMEDDVHNCPTIIKYKASIVFDIKSGTPAYKSVAQFQASKGNPPITEAVPRVTLFDVTVYSDKVHYTPQLTRFLQLDIMPQEKSAPSNK